MITVIKYFLEVFELDLETSEVNVIFSILLFLIKKAKISENDTNKLDDEILLIIRNKIISGEDLIYSEIYKQLNSKCQWQFFCDRMKKLERKEFIEQTLDLNEKITIKVLNKFYKHFNMI